MSKSLLTLALALLCAGCDSAGTADSAAGPVGGATASVACAPAPTCTTCDLTVTWSAAAAATELWLATSVLSPEETATRGCAGELGQAELATQITVPVDTVDAFTVPATTWSEVTSGGGGVLVCVSSGNTVLACGVAAPRDGADPVLAL